MNPNQPSEGPIYRPIEPRGFFSGIKVRPIVVGAVIDYVATSVFILLYLLFYHVKEPLDESGLPEEAINQALEEVLSSHEGLLAVMLIGAFCTALGGYVAGRMAQAEKIKHGALVGAASLIFGILDTAMTGEGSRIPYAYAFVGYLVAIPAGALGGYIAQEWAKPPVVGNSSEKPA